MNNILLTGRQTLTVNMVYWNLFNRFQLVLECWKEDPSERPTFDQATKSLERMMVEDTPYFDPELVDESKAYYNEVFEEDDTAPSAVATFTD